MNTFIISLCNNIYTYIFTGFLSTGAEGIQGNAGMKDQVEALKFVKNQISYFDGDPDKITIFGESAGAAAVTCLCSSCTVSNV